MKKKQQIYSISASEKRRFHWRCKFSGRVCKTCQRIWNSNGKKFIDSFNNNDFSELSAISRVQCYLNIAYKYAGIKINALVDHFMNTAVYACIIEQLIDSTDSKSKCKLHWNQNCILYLERGAAVLMNIEIWKTFIYKRDELFNKADETMIQGIK